MNIQFITDFFTYDFLLIALVGLILMSFTSGIISPLVVSKRYSFLGAAVAHSAILSVVLSVLIVPLDSIWSFPLTLFFSLITTSFLALASYKNKLPSDSMIGIFFSFTMGLGLLIYSIALPDQSNLMGFLFGNILLVSKTDLFWIGGVTLLTLLAIIPNLNKWISFIVDEQGAKLNNIAIARYHFGLYILLTLFIISSIKLSGAILINSYLILPGFFALSTAKNIKNTFIYSTLFVLTFSIIGIIISNSFDIPPGSTLAVVGTCMLLIKKLMTT